MKKRSHYFIRSVIGALAIGLILRYVHLSTAIEHFRNLGVTSVVLIFLVTFFLIAISAFKWKIFLNSLKINIPLMKLCSFYVIGYFFNNFLPTNVGGDVVRAVLTSEKKEKYLDSLVAVFMERFTGFVALIIFVIFLVPVAAYHFNFPDVLKYVLTPMIILVVGFGFLFFVKPDLLRRISLSHQFMSAFRDKVVKLLNAIQSFKAKKKILAYTLFISLLFNLITIINVHVVAWALDITVSLFSLIVFVPVILLISAIPFSINGIGIVEGAYVLCLTQAGMPPPEALSVALAMRAKNIIVSILGGVFLLFYKRQGLKLSFGRANAKANPGEK